MNLPQRTRSLCPVCLRRIDALYTEGEGGVHLEKRCPEHGLFRTLVWADRAAPAWSAWNNDSPPSQSGLLPVRQGCPYDCGLCSAHGQRTCCALVEVTSRCDMGCPVCYASSSASPSSPDPSFSEVQAQLARLFDLAGPCNVQLSGGEPCVRDDIPAIIRAAKAQGFPFVQLNTNGLRLAADPAYARALASADLNVVYLQFDGLSAATFQTLRGADYRVQKQAALANCMAAGLAVVLVTTVARGVNDHELGDLLHLALASGPLLRGLHLQPMACFGRHPWDEPPLPLTLPDVMAALSSQSLGMVQATDFHPPSSEHALCSFSAVYRRVPHGLECTGSGLGCCAAPGQEAARARDFVAQHWSPPKPAPAALCDDFDRFLSRAGMEQRFTISAMAFQDARNVDLDRLRRCHIHILQPDGSLVPFCACNLTALDGTPLHRTRHGVFHG